MGLGRLHRIQLLPETEPVISRLMTVGCAQLRTLLTDWHGIAVAAVAAAVAAGVAAEDEDIRDQKRLFQFRSCWSYGKGCVHPQHAADSTAAEDEKPRGGSSRRLVAQALPERPSDAAPYAEPS